MKIAVHDHQYYSLQRRLLNEGSDLLLYIGPEKIDGDLNITDSTKGSITQVLDFVASKADWYLTSSSDLGYYAYDALDWLGKPVLGYRSDSEVLESDRSFVFSLFTKAQLPIKTPQQLHFTSQADAKAFLSSRKAKSKSWVLKQGLEATTSNPENDLRTVISHPDHRGTISLIDNNPAWFNDLGSGSVLVEEFIQGHEVCFGAWFDGEKFLTPFYACEEHKDAQNGNRSLCLTGEVGNWLTWFYDPCGTIVDAFRKFEPFLRGKFRGMLDINTIVNQETGELHLIELTPRFGRPTLESMLGSSTNRRSWSEAFNAMANRTKGYEKKWSDLFDCRHSVTVSVFSYGLPIINPHSPIGVGYKSFAYQPPVLPTNLKGNKNCSFQPFGTTFNNGTWMTTRNDRQFFIVGASDIVREARSLAYQPLDNYSLLGCTWRDDVGLKHTTVLDVLTSTGVIDEN